MGQIQKATFTHDIRAAPWKIAVHCKSLETKLFCYFIVLSTLLFRYSLSDWRKSKMKICILIITLLSFLSTSSFLLFGLSFIWTTTGDLSAQNSPVKRCALYCLEGIQSYLPSIQNNWLNWTGVRGQVIIK